MQGYKGWVLSEGKLKSSVQDFIWNNATERALCKHGCDVAECLENHSCTCGFYSLKDLKRLAREYPSFEIYGTVYSHGVVTEGVSGFRAEKMTILSLFTMDFALGKRLQEAYPGVAIMTPPKEILDLQKAYSREDNWQLRSQRAIARRQELAKQLQDARDRYPGGFDAEKERLGRILRNKSRQELIAFSKEYAAIDEWAARVNGGRIEKRSRKAKAGDMVFEANNTVHPYVFIGSCRPNQYASMRYMLDRNGVLVRRPNIRRWDEESELMEARKQAIEEWE